MGKMTFVFEFEEGKEPPVSAAMDFYGGRIVSAAFYDYRNDQLTEDEAELIRDALYEVGSDQAIAIAKKISLLTQ